MDSLQDDSLCFLPKVWKAHFCLYRNYETSINKTNTKWFKFVKANVALFSQLAWLTVPKAAFSCVFGLNWCFITLVSSVLCVFYVLCTWCIQKRTWVCHDTLPNILQTTFDWWTALLSHWNPGCLNLGFSYLLCRHFCQFIISAPLIFTEDVKTSSDL